VVRYTAVAFGLLVLAYATLGTWASGSVCVQLPNRLLIGYEALFDPDRPYWVPTVVLKYPDGTSVLSDVVGRFQFTETTVWGGTQNGWLGPDHPAYRDDVFFAYRPDVGLVYRHEDPDTYERLKEEAGPIVWVLGQEVHTNLLGTFLKLVKDPAGKRTFCPLRVLPGRRRGVE
jgi:hypothetical protein